MSRQAGGEAPRDSRTALDKALECARLAQALRARSIEASGSRCRVLLHYAAVMDEVVSSYLVKLDDEQGAE